MRITFALVLLGLAGMVTPWGVHLRQGFFEPRLEVQQAYVAAYFLSILISFIVLIGAALRLRQGRAEHREQAVLALAMAFGAAGLHGAGMVFLLSMM